MEKGECIRKMKSGPSVSGVKGASYSTAIRSDRTGISRRTIGAVVSGAPIPTRGFLKVKSNHKNLDPEALGAEIFGLVEADQGYAHISDALGTNNIEDADSVFNTVRRSLVVTERSAKKMRQFLRKYGQSE